MKKYIFLFLGFVAFLVVRLQTDMAEAGKKTAKPAVTAASGDGDCGTKKFCVAIYVAPWCGACRSQEHIFKALVERSKTMKDYGMKVVVGQGRAAGDNEAMAKSFGSAGVVDADSSFLRKHGVSYFPSFFVLDTDRDILLRDQEAREWVAEKYN